MLAASQTSLDARSSADAFLGCLPEAALPKSRPARRRARRSGASSWRDSHQCAPRAGPDGTATPHRFVRPLSVEGQPKSQPDLQMLRCRGREPDISRRRVAAPHVDATWIVRGERRQQIKPSTSRRARRGPPRARGAADQCRRLRLPRGAADAHLARDNDAALELALVRRRAATVGGARDGRVERRHARCCPLRQEDDASTAKIIERRSSSELG